MQTFGGFTSGGYNTYHRLHASGRDWLPFALDWRVSARTPVILTTHDLAFADEHGTATHSPRGEHLGPLLAPGISGARRAAVRRAG
ncbi:MAG TPA: hypothetical protein DGG94_14765 [Micromonosporaceae bacterium]|nr:hypothetical protein [Micromonosporaceae bacterium]HCU51036.1 hypothetical protein [Micromonosporaceae bacterium]